MTYALAQITGNKLLQDWMQDGLDVQLLPDQS